MTGDGDLGSPHKSPLEHRVHDRLRKTYPDPATTAWTCRSSWERNTVPLDRIAYGKRPGGRDPDKVASMAKRLAKGWKPKRVILVDPGGNQKMKVADGYHRLLAMQHEGVTEARAFVGTPRIGAGDWRSDIKRMQLTTSDATGLENHGG